MKKLFSLVLAAVLAVSLAAPALAASSPFPDVSSGAWYAEGVSYVVEHSIFTGNSDGTFNPKGTMSRGMFVVALSRLVKADTSRYTAGSGYADNFTDVPGGLWCGNEIRWASTYAGSPAAGTYEKDRERSFRPNDPITREEIAVILYNYLRRNGLELEEDPAAPAVFSDMAVVSTAEGRDAVEHMRRVGLMTGSNGQFNPQGELSRAEAAVAFMRFNQLLSKAHKAEENYVLTPTLVLMPSIEAKTASIYTYYSPVWVKMMYTAEAADESLIRVNPDDGTVYAVRELEPGTEPIQTYVTVTYLRGGDTHRVNVTVIPPDAAPDTSRPDTETPAPDSGRDLTPFTVTTPSFSFVTWLHFGEDNNICGRIRITDPYWGLTDRSVNGDSYGYTFTSSDPSVIQVDPKGQLYAPRVLAPDDAPVKAVITVTNQRDGHSVEVPVTISPDPEWYTVDDDYIAAYAAEVLRLVNELRAEVGSEPLVYIYRHQETINTRTARLEKIFAHDGIGTPSPMVGENIISGAPTGPITLSMAPLNTEQKYM